MGNKVYIMLALVTGGTGAIGPRVVQSLHEAGFRIKVFSIDAPIGGLFPPDVEVMTGDITDRLAVQSAMEGVSAVVHLAAMLHIINPDDSLEKKYYQINVVGTQNVMDAALACGIKKVVYPSTIAVYGDSSGQILTEKSLPRPDTWYAKTKLEAERFVLDGKDAEGCSLGVVLRLGAVYGPRVKGNYQKLLQALDRRRFIPIGKGMNRRTLVYEEDVAKAILLGLNHPGAPGHIFNVSDGSFPTLNEIIEVMCRALSRSVPKVFLPESPVRFLAFFIESISRTLGLHPPISRSMVDKYTEDMAVDSSLIQSKLGFKPEYDLSRGWKETIDIMRKADEL
jgi:nucleoside-diphosphate-sugar epimerase